MLTKYSSYILCLLISIFVVALYVNNFDSLVRLELNIQDLLNSHAGGANYSSDIVLINIDDPTLNEYGDWPWDRDLVADLVAAVGSGQPKTVLLNFVFDRNTSQNTLGYNDTLAGQISWMNNVIIPYEINPAQFQTKKMTIHKHLKKYSLHVNNELGILKEDETLLTRKVFLPPDQLCEYAAGLGFIYDVYDDDKKVRWSPLTMHYEGFYYPSIALITATHKLGLQSSDITIIGGEKIVMGNIEIPTNHKCELLINYNKQGQSFPQISAADILGEKANVNALAGKLVVISVTSELVSDYFPTPISASLQSNEKTANIIENIVHSNYIKKYDNTTVIDLLILFGLGAIFAFILPKVVPLYRLLIILACFVLLTAISYFLFNYFRIIINSLYIALELFLLLLACPLLGSEFLSGLSISGGEGFRPKPKKPRKTNQDEDSIPVVKVISEKAGDSAGIKTTAMSKSSHEKPAEMVETVAADYKANTADEKTVANEIPPSTSKPEIISPPKQEKDTKPEETSQSQPVQDYSGETPTISNLGRYKVYGILGKGAMGTVYKGVDPEISRKVALKTIRLDFVHDPAELAELRERLSREARAAGMLSHPNIVTIYDVGHENSLQYIAMEYLEGQTLEDMIRRKVKFSYKIISKIITQISSALEYAHDQGIIHRDVKPANIMILPDYTVKVMDFGIARVDSTSMTRTGIAMGTPNYISPEQLQGKPVDKRCDIFSLGVVIYELLTYQLPFRGENLTSLIYNIVNTEPEALTSINSSIPHLFERVISKALAKNPDARYQNASEISAALSDFISTFAT